MVGRSTNIIDYKRPCLRDKNTRTINVDAILDLLRVPKRIITELRNFGRTARAFVLKKSRSVRTPDD